MLKFSVRYWLILTHQMQEDTVTALLYSYSLPHAEKTQIFKQVRQSIAEICFTINQYCLLNQLHDTRVAPELLIPKDDEEQQQHQQQQQSQPPTHSLSSSALNIATTGSSSATGASAAAAAAAAPVAVPSPQPSPEDDEIDQPLLVEGNPLKKKTPTASDYYNFLNFFLLRLFFQVRVRTDANA